MSVYLQEAPFFAACTDGDGPVAECLVLCMVFEPGRVVLTGGRSNEFKLATVHDPLLIRRFSSIDAAYALARKYVPEARGLSGVHLMFRVI